MKQALLKKGIVYPVELPQPTVKEGYVKIKVYHSCISAGTEMSGVSESRKSIIKRALDNPKKITAAITYYKNQGLKKTKDKLNTVADSFKESGYSISGEVVEIGYNVLNFNIGDIVSAGGMKLAVHAEYVVVPINLVVKVPKGLDTLYASTGTVGSIALQGVRRSELRLGEYGVVLGVGLIGLITVQLLKSAGIRVACIDLSDGRLDLVKKMGVELVINPTKENPVNAIKNWTGGYGADAVLFTAATSSNEPLSQAFQMTRRKGKVVLVGVSGMTINRSDIYANEIDFLISTSYGPGRYDDNYELKGLDYPYSYVRWTENRNIAEFLRLVRDGHVDFSLINPLVYPFENISEAFQDLEKDPENKILAIIEYDRKDVYDKSPDSITFRNDKKNKREYSIGIIGAGSYVVSTLLPILTNMTNKFKIHTVVNRGGKKALDIADRFHAQKISNDINDILENDDIDIVFITTRHDNHAELILQCLKKGKNVFVEKPLATTQEQLDSIKEFYADGFENKPLLMVGFNRRFSNYIREIKAKVSSRINPMFMHYRMNAGYSPTESWVHEDGGRIIGEGCHLVDLMLYITDSKITEITASSIKPTNESINSSDNKTFSLKFADGSVGVIDYFAIGHKDIPKENLEVHFDMKSIVMTDYKSIEGFGIKVNSISDKTPKKGQDNEMEALYQALVSKKWPISFEDMVQTTETTFIVNAS
ncbi:bi-domain-containing oxidoreductase [Lentimicrobium sp. S6]|uniref:bi-domain-containing oxidoreductase n=1 Tax=Lentimicrobium sp. S6 TaxID=2735872 RepID=UPI001555C2D4|nr:bi-domain-containing oxidoreductase [Lentimicrobium sp. S6]NPD46739.1 zinc-binding dehydrogenase [Lentimicrobium sp. S6]